MSRRIAITGVSRGLGRAMVEGFIGRGHSIYGCATNATAIDELRDEFSAPHHFDVVDISHSDAVEAWAKKIFADGGAPDLLINNAAVINRSEPLWEVHSREFESLMHVNVCGTFHTIKHMTPAMIAAGTGVIVNFSSGWGRSTSPEVVPYCASKFAIEGLSKGLSQEIPRGLAVVAFNPGVIHTDMLDSCFGGSASAFPSPSEWAEKAVPYLLSLDESDNGKSVNVP